MIRLECYYIFNLIKDFLMRSLTKALRRTSALAAKTAPMFKISPFIPIRPMTMPINYQFSENITHNQNILKSTYEGDGFQV